jgi:protein pelota
MQIIYNNTQNGELKIQIDCLDDLWILYNIIVPNDQIKGRTVRRVVLRDGDTGSRRPMTLLLNVKKVEFHEFSNRLRILGTILDGPADLISMGDHHTFNLEPGSKITIFKEKWFRNDIERIRRNLNKKNAAMVLCVAIDKGLANLSLLSNYSLNPITEIQKNVPGKRYAKQHHDQVLKEFYESVSLVIKENVSRHNIKYVILCGPGFVKEHFFKHYAKEYQHEGEKIQTRILNASSGELSAIYEILRNGSVAEQMVDVEVAHEEMLMSEFIEHLGKNDGLITYGLEEIFTISQMGAVESLLICDHLIRTHDVKLREKIEEIMNNVENARGKVHILSTKNPAGEQLENYGNIAAVLRYRVDL